MQKRCDYCNKLFEGDRRFCAMDCARGFKVLVENRRRALAKTDDKLTQDLYTREAAQVRWEIKEMSRNART